MPTYEYNCTQCGNRFEIHQSIKDDPIETCPRCGGQVKKVYSPIGIAFKGSGFYKTDSRKSSSSSKSPSPATGESPANSVTGTESASTPEKPKSEPSQTTPPKPANPSGDSKKAPSSSPTT